jgi:GNAT superfamily N-acetyltransferase
MGERAAYLCVKADAGNLAELAQLRTAWTVEQGGAPAEDFVERFEAWWEGQQGRRHAWLVHDGSDRAVAMGNVAVFERMPRPGLPDARWAYVGNVWVDPAHRRRGVATLLMRAVVTWCRAERMERIVLNPSEESLPLYRSLGFRTADDLMRLDL